MPLDPSFAGRAYPPTAPYEVGREKIREFADAIGDPDPAYRDPRAARALGHPDVIAPPTLAVVLAFRGMDLIVGDPALGLDYSRVVHGDQRFSWVRPIVAGDRLTSTAVVESVRSVSGNDMITIRCEVATEDGEPVGTTWSMLVARAPEEAGGA